MASPQNKTQNKTKPTALAARDFIAGVRDPARRADATALVRIFQRATGEKPVMWGSSIIGFGTYHYRYESGREGDMCLAGFSPRSNAFAVYALSGAKGENELLAKLGRHKRGKGCLYVAKLADVDAKILEELVRTARRTRASASSATSASTVAKLSARVARYRTRRRRAATCGAPRRYAGRCARRTRGSGRDLRRA